MVGANKIAFVVSLLLLWSGCRSTNDANCEHVLLLQQKTMRQSQKKGEDANYIAAMFPAGIATTSSLTEDGYKQIVNAVHDLYEQVDASVSANFNPRGSFVACLLRTAGHDFMDFRLGGGGGSDGCVNFQDADNAGISDCLRKFNIPSLYERFAKTVSLADFLVITAEAAIGRTATGWSGENRWSLDSLEFRLLRSFKYGRETKTTCEFTLHRMPNPEHGCEGRGDDKPGLKQIFVEHIFKGHEFPWTLTAAISGAHTVGSANLTDLGYNGAWGSAEQMGKFNNEYFKRLVMSSWAPELAVNNNPTKNQWQLSDQKRDSHKEMMLTTDMCLVYAHTPKRLMCEKDVKDKSTEYFGKKVGKYQGHHFFCRYLYERVGPESPLRYSEGYADLDPTKHMCCAWIAPLSLLQGRVFHHISGYDSSTTLPLKSIADWSANRTFSHELQWTNTRNEICGVDVSKQTLTQKNYQDNCENGLLQDDSSQCKKKGLREGM